MEASYMGGCNEFVPQSFLPHTVNSNLICLTAKEANLEMRYNLREKD